MVRSRLVGLVFVFAGLYTPVLLLTQETSTRLLFAFPIVALFLVAAAMGRSRD